MSARGQKRAARLVAVWGVATATGFGRPFRSRRAGEAWRESARPLSTPQPSSWTRVAHRPAVAPTRIPAPARNDLPWSARHPQFASGSNKSEQGRVAQDPDGPRSTVADASHFGAAQGPDLCLSRRDDFVGARPLRKIPGSTKISPKLQRLVTDAVLRVRCRQTAGRRTTGIHSAVTRLRCKNVPLGKYRYGCLRA